MNESWQKFLKKGQKAPLEYILDVLNDPSIDIERRDRLAIAALPYCHARIMPMRDAKKLRQTRDAEMAGFGTAWAKDLDAGFDVRVS